MEMLCSALQIDIILQVELSGVFRLRLSQSFTQCVTIFSERRAILPNMAVHPHMLDPNPSCMVLSRLSLTDLYRKHSIGEGRHRRLSRETNGALLGRRLANYAQNFGHLHVHYKRCIFVFMDENDTPDEGYS